MQKPIFGRLPGTCDCCEQRGEADEWLAQSSWAGYFDEAQVQGTMVVVDQRHHPQLVYKHKRADERFSAGSSFKVPDTLFAPDAGIAKDEFQVFG